MKPATHPTALRIQQRLSEAGLGGQVVEFEVPTRTSAEAAAAIGCQVAEIAKSVVLRGCDSGRAVVVVARGDSRVCERKVGALLGEAVGRADARFVRAATGFVIGGVAPFGYPNAVHVLMDEGLRFFGRVWAAAGTPNAVFPLSPAELQRLTSADWSDVRLDPD